MSLREDLDQVKHSALQELEQVRDEDQLQAWKSSYLGRSGRISDFMEELKTAPTEMKPELGKGVNRVKTTLENAYEQHQDLIRAHSMARSLEEESLDVTLPGRQVRVGRLHPSTQALREIETIWRDMGFEVYPTREVETDEINFELLNFPRHHPARDMQDTFYTDQPGVILRTHTSPGQIRIMRERAPEPIRAILPGMCYRYEQISARAEIQFTQVEGLAVGQNISMADLKGTLIAFARRMFGENVRTRFRASYFPFTEPSAELDIECFVCDGQGCPVCKKTGWLEILGCGMVHPQVLINGGYDPTEFSGFAFGMGPERIKMLQHRIDDIRYFWANDLRFLEQV